MRPLVSSILGFPEEKGKACVMFEIEDDDEESQGPPEIMSGGWRKTTSSETVGPAMAALELVDMAASSEKIMGPFSFAGAFAILYGLEGNRGVLIWCGRVFIVHYIYQSQGCTVSNKFFF